MKSACWIGAVALLILVARGQARPAAEAAEETARTEWEHEKTNADASPDEAPSLNKATEASGESTHSPIAREQHPHDRQPLIPDETTFKETILPNSSNSVQTPEDVSEAKINPSLITTASEHKEESSFYPHTTSAIPLAQVSDPMSSSSLLSQDTDTTSVQKFIDFSSSTQHTTASTVHMQEHTPEHKFDDGSKIEPASIENRVEELGEGMAPKHEAAFSKANSSQPLAEHPLNSNELLSSVQPSTDQDISNRFRPHSLSEEESPSKTIKIEADGAAGNATDHKHENASTMISSDPNTLLFTALTLAVAVNGITTLSSSELTDPSFVDSPTSKTTSPSVTSTSHLFQASEELHVSSFVDTSISKDSSPSMSSSTSFLSQTPAELPVSSSTNADNSTPTRYLLTSTPSMSQTSAELPDFPPVDTRTFKESTLSMVSSKSPLPQASAELPGSPSLDTMTLNYLSPFTSSSKSPLPQASAELPGSPSLDTMTLNYLSPFTTSSKSPLPQASAELPGSPSLDTMTLNYLSPFTTSSKSPLPQTSAELSDSPFVDINALKDSTPTMALSKSPFHQVSTEISDSPSVDSVILKHSTPAIALSKLPLTGAPEELPDLNILNNSILKDMVSSLSSTKAKPPESSSDAAEILPLDSADNILPSPLRMHPVLSEEKPEAADVLKLPDIGDDDMDMAATMVFRPVYSYRQDNARRRFFRSLTDQR